MSGTREERQKIQKEYFNKIKEDKKESGSKETKKVVDWDSVPKKIQREVNDIFKEMDFMTKDEKDKAEKYIDRLLKKYEVEPNNNS